MRFQPQRTQRAQRVSGMSDEGKYIGRWMHRLKLHFRVWPKWKEAHDAIASMKTITVNGMRINDDGLPEVWHTNAHGSWGYAFEMSEDDFDVLTAIPKAGARLPLRKGDMTIHAPGTFDSRVKKECWLEVPVFAYHDAPEAMATLWGRGWKQAAPHEVAGTTPEDALGQAGAPCGRIVFFERDEDIDEDVIFREVVEHDAMIVLNRRPVHPGGTGVSAETGKRLVRRARFWTVPGRRPWEDGGALRGYQFPDRIVRWHPCAGGASREEVQSARLRLMHETVREQGRASRRTYFFEKTVDRFAERVGMSRQRVVARFLDDGVVDWLMRSVEAVQPVPGRDANSLLRGRVSDAVEALEFYYRAVEGMAERSSALDAGGRDMA